MTTDEWVEEWLDVPFEWGVTDCGTLVLRYLRDILNINLLDETEYFNVKEAIHEHKKTGGVETRLKELGFKQFALSVAQKGDIVVEPYAHRNLFPAYGIALVPLYFTVDLEKSRLRSLINTKGPSYILRYG